MAEIKAKPAPKQDVLDQERLVKHASNVIRTEVRQLDRGLAQLVMTVR